MGHQAPPHEAEEWLRRLFASSIRPDARRSLSDWSEAERVVAEGGYQGAWRNARAPYLAEIMDYCTLHCPTPRVSVCGGNRPSMGCPCASITRPSS